MPWFCYPYHTYDMAQIHATARKSTLALRQRKRWLRSQLQLSPDGLRASLVERFSGCGKANCHCHRDGPWGCQRSFVPTPRTRTVTSRTTARSKNKTRCPIDHCKPCSEIVGEPAPPLLKKSKRARIK